MGVPGRRFLGGGAGVLGGRDGGPAADAHALARAAGGSVGATLAGSVAGLETFVGDVASDLQALWESAGVGRGRGSREGVGPVGSFAVIGGEDRGVIGRCAVECRYSPWSMATASDPGVRREGAGRPAAVKSGATAVASVGRGASGPSGAGQGGRCADGV